MKRRQMKRPLQINLQIFFFFFLRNHASADEAALQINLQQMNRRRFLSAG